MRRRPLAALLLLGVLGLAWWLGEPRPATPADRIGPCEVLRVTDGDTLRVRCDGRGERVRLLQIDTPERGEPLYAEAGRVLAELIDDAPVTLERWHEERDEHGRLLAYVFVGERNLNAAMIEAGMTPYFDRYGAGRYPGEFRAAERAARAAGRGIWSSTRR